MNIRYKVDNFLTLAFALTKGQRSNRTHGPFILCPGRGRVSPVGLGRRGSVDQKVVSMSHWCRSFVVHSTNSPMKLDFTRNEWIFISWKLPVFPRC